MILEDDVMPGPDPREWRVRDPLNMSEFNVECEFSECRDGRIHGCDGRWWVINFVAMEWEWDWDVSREGNVAGSYDRSRRDMFSEFVES